uniref:Homing endonuclease LAGLIDADG domain-containing protein n=1 Tax=Orbilia brochopaga TaxID=3140254 RepID=A0A4Y5N057_9PEZI|nr:hypothetical protein [Drechslerella brochopaga]
MNWCKIAELMINKFHLTLKWLNEICSIKTTIISNKKIFCIYSAGSGDARTNKSDKTIKNLCQGTMLYAGFKSSCMLKYLKYIFINKTISRKPFNTWIFRDLQRLYAWVFNVISFIIIKNHFSVKFLLWHVINFLVFFKLLIYLFL